MAPQVEGDMITGFRLLKQKQSNWCWASIGVALCAYFDRPSKTQCQLANLLVPQAGPDCCQSPGNADCNSIQLMSAVLAKIGVDRLRSPNQPQDAEKFTFDLVQKEIRRRRAIICLLTGGGGDHYVVVVGWSISNGMPMLHVDDPATGRRATVGFLDFFSFRDRQLLQFTRLA
jgi:Papain-like cysteine protease AvrRpt2